MTSVESSAALNDYVASQTAAKTTKETKSLWGDFDTFLTVLTTQLKNQDPTEPVDASKFTQQLVQYAQVEQQISSNDKLDSILNTINSNGITPLLNYVGQYVETGSTEKMVVQNSTGLMAYVLDSEATSVSISVQDDKGNSIATINGATTTGLNRIAWDGKLADGTTAKDGVYKFVLTAKDSSGEAMKVPDIRIIGQISGVETDAKGNISLKMGDHSVADTDIMSVFAAVSASPDTTKETTDTES